VGGWHLRANAAAHEVDLSRLHLEQRVRRQVRDLGLPAEIGRLTRLDESPKVLNECDGAVLRRVYPGGLAMRSKRAVLMVCLSLLFVPTMVLAHHGLETQFDTRKTITLTGAVEKIDWSNPHVRLYLEVKDGGNTMTWEVDMGSPNLQMRNGWKIDTYRRGDRVAVDVHPARDGSSVAYGRKITALRGVR
jgi:hypothetical protein